MSDTHPVFTRGSNLALVRISDWKRIEPFSLDSKSNSETEKIVEKNWKNIYVKLEEKIISKEAKSFQMKLKLNLNSMEKRETGIVENAYRTHGIGW